MAGPGRNGAQITRRLDAGQSFTMLQPKRLPAEAWVVAHHIPGRRIEAQQTADHVVLGFGAFARRLLALALDVPLLRLPGPLEPRG